MPRHIFLVVLAVLMAGCAETQQVVGENDKAAIGAATGAVLGGVAGAVLDKNDVRGVAIGAAAGAAIGGGIGYLFDRQEREFRVALEQEQLTRQAEVERLREDLLKITLQNEVLFDSGKAEVKPAFAPTLEKLASVLAKYDRSVATVFGHTDNVGSERLNQELSVRRAEAVSQALSARGVPAGRLSAAGRGEREPRVDNTTEANRQLNRRVEILVSPRG